MDRKTVLPPAAESIVRGELAMMGADPDDLDRFLAQAQATAIEPSTQDPTSVAGVEGADGAGRFLLQGRPFRLGELQRRPERALPVGIPG